MQHLQVMMRLLPLALLDLDKYGITPAMRNAVVLYVSLCEAYWRPSHHREDFAPGQGFAVLKKDLVSLGLRGRWEGGRGVLKGGLGDSGEPSHRRNKGSGGSVPLTKKSPYSSGTAFPFVAPIHASTS